MTTLEHRAINECATLGIGDREDIRMAYVLGPSEGNYPQNDVDGVIAVCVKVMMRALQAEDNFNVAKESADREEYRRAETA